MIKKVIVFIDFGVSIFATFHNKITSLQRRRKNEFLNFCCYHLDSKKMLFSNFQISIVTECIRLKAPNLHNIFVIFKNHSAGRQVQCCIQICFFYVFFDHSTILFPLLWLVCLCVCVYVFLSG